MTYDPQALAEAESHLVNYLEHSDPPRSADLFEVTEAAKEHFDRTGAWSFDGVAPEQVEDLLRRHSR